MEDNNLYLALCKKGRHSYLLIGRVTSEGKNEIVMRVGKRDLLPPKYESFFGILTHPGKMLTTGIASMLGYEGLHFGKSFYYKAFDLSVPQLTDFYRLVAEIQIAQRNDPYLQSVAKKWLLKEARHCKNFNKTTFHENLEAGKLPWVKNDQIEYHPDGLVLNWYFNISAHLPVLQDNHLLDFSGKENLNGTKYTEIACNWPESRLNEKKISANTTHLSLKHNCRTTALSLLETILGSEHGISKSFLKSPGYFAKMKENESTPESFFILPAPPSCFDIDNPKKMRILKKMFARLEAVPRKAPNDKDTQDKFQRLKMIYKKIAGDSSVNIADYLSEITISHGAELFKKRKPSLFSRTFNLNTSSTKQLCRQIQKEAQKINEESVNPGSRP